MEETTSSTESCEGSLMPGRKNSFANKVEQLWYLKTFMHWVVYVVRRLPLKNYRQYPVINRMQDCITDVVRIWSGKGLDEEYRTRDFNLILCADLHSVIDESIVIANRMISVQ
jgi:hypothetical protein